MPPSNAQLKKIWASAREIGIEEEQLRDLVEDVSGARSISGLSFRQAGAVIDTLVRLGAASGSYRKPSGRRSPPGVAKLITGAQRTKIRELREELGGKWTEDPYFEGACIRLMEKQRPATAGEGAKVIEMLKARLDYEQRREADGSA